MPEMSIGPSADDLVVLFESDSRAPILSQVPPGPQSDSDADPGECDARNRKGIRPLDNGMTKNTDSGCVAKEHGKAKNLQKKDAVARGEGFLADRPARL